MFARIFLLPPAVGALLIVATSWLLDGPGAAVAVAPYAAGAFGVFVLIYAVAVPGALLLGPAPRPCRRDNPHLLSAEYERERPCVEQLPPR